MYEAIKIDSEQNTMRYTNLKEGIFDASIVFQNNVVQNEFDQLKMTLTGVGIEVFVTTVKSHILGHCPIFPKSEFRGMPQLIGSLFS
jgi:hypothetical protein